MKKHKTSFFDRHPDMYDLMVPWQQRLARELPFFAKLFKEHKVKSVLDCGCGSGWHAITFAKLGLKAYGMDNSKPMLSLARLNAKREKSSAKFYSGDFKHVDKSVPHKVDALICLGNALAILQNQSEILQTFKSMNRTLTSHGIVIFQMLNFGRMPKHQLTTLPVRVIQKGGKEYLFLRIFDIGDQSAKINFVLLIHDKGQWSQETNSTHLFYYTQPLLNRLLKKAGFSKVRMYGDMSLSRFSVKSSHDFVVIAEK